MNIARHQEDKDEGRIGRREFFARGDQIKKVLLEVLDRYKWRQDMQQLVYKIIGDVFSTGANS